MDKTTNTGANKEKDSFKNTPHMADRSSDLSADTVGSDINASGASAAGRSASGSSLGDARNAIMEQARPAVDYVRNNFGPVLDNSQRYLGDAQRLVKQYPYYAIAGAAAIGVFVGMMFSRSSSRSIS